MRTNTLALLLVGGLAALGCNAETDDMLPATERLEELDEHIDGLATSQVDHSQMVEAATDLAQITALETDHRGDMTHHFEEMEHTLGELGECTHDGKDADAEAMHHLTESVSEEVEAHVTAMGLAADLEAAQQEEARYAAAFADLVTQMHSEHDAMTDDMADHMCPGHGDQHDEQHDDDPDHHG